MTLPLPLLGVVWAWSDSSVFLSGSSSLPVVHVIELHSAGWNVHRFLIKHQGMFSSNHFLWAQGGGLVSSSASRMGQKPGDLGLQ